MARHIKLATHLSPDDLEQRARQATDAVAAWQILWLLARGQTATQVAAVTGYSAYWIGPIARRYHEAGPTGVEDRRHQARGRTGALSAEQQAELRQAVRGPAPDGEAWTGRTVAAWMTQRLGRPIAYWLGWAYWRRLGLRRSMPRPRHGQADAAAQEAFKGGFARSCARSRPPSRTRRSSPGRSTSTASGSSPFSSGSGPSQASGLWLRSSTATRGAP
jgi:transposase